MKQCEIFRLLIVALFAISNGKANEIAIKVDVRKWPGHAWAVVTCKEKKVRISFGPVDPDDWSVIFRAVPSTLNYDPARKPSIGHSILLNSAECNSMIEEIQSTSGTSYRLALHNCTTTVLNTLKAGGISIKSNEGFLEKYLGLEISSPKQLAQDLIEMQRKEPQSPPPPPEDKNRIHPNLRWRCVYSNTPHRSPEQCKVPSLGGTWIIAE